jgi:flagellin FlaB
MRNICKIFKRKDVGSIGVGAMIVFIAMVLVAGIAASVLIQTSAKLEIQAMQTGQETTNEVSGGIAVYSVIGYTTSSSNDISKIAIGVRPRSGSEGIDLSEAYIELSDTNKKVVLKYSSTYFLDPTGQNDLFSAAVFPDEGDNPASEFGILVVEDGDDSISVATSPMINRGDKVYLCVNTTGCFSDISERTDVWGVVVPELGSPGMITFRTPASYTENVMNLQ